MRINPPRSARVIHQDPTGNLANGVPRAMRDEGRMTAIGRDEEPSR